MKLKQNKKLFVEYINGINNEKIQ